MHKDTHKQKTNEQNKNKQTKKNNKGNNFLGSQTSKGVKVACFAFDAFFTLKSFL